MAQHVESSRATRLRRRRTSASSKIVFIVLLAGAVLFAIPFIWMVMTSFDEGAIVNIPFPPRFFPLKPSLKPYVIAFTNVKLLLYAKNTLVMCAGVIAFSVASAFLSGYALSKIRFKGYRLVFTLSLCVMMIPFESTMLSRFMLFQRIGILNTYWAFYLPAVVYPFGTFMAKQFMDTLPDSLRDAAKIDGAGDFMIFLRVYMPLCGAAVATMIILQFLGSWNDLLWPLLVTSDMDKYTIQVGMAMFSLDKGGQPLPSIMMAITTISILPVLVMYLFLQRYVVEGIAMSGIKQ